MRIAVIGAGPVGLVSGSALAWAGHDVRLVEIDATRADRIAAGEPPFHENGLETLLRDVIHASRLRVTRRAEDAVPDADVVLICVGTPSRDDGADLTNLIAASRDVGRALKGASGYRVVVVKSTVPPGTTTGLVEPVLREESALTAADLDVAMNPEFLREGLAVDDMLHPDRIVIGVQSGRARTTLEDVYRPFDAPIVVLTPTGAEMTKYASNALLASLVSFSNEIASLCEAIPDADAVEVLRAVHADRRFRPPDGRPAAPSTITTYLLPGLGYGGSCFPKDTLALSAWARTHGIGTPLLDAVRAINAQRPERVLELLRSRLHLSGARVAVLGLAFKPGTDDLRESRSLDLVRLLHDAGAEVRACDPVAATEAARLLDGVAQVGDDVDGALCAADAAVLATAWPVYVALDPEHVRSVMRRPLILDARRALDPVAWSAHCEYLPIGVKA
ncbi:MAG: UDP-glucose dehydrogenase family protein [Longimicrobiales bacterium]